MRESPKLSTAESEAMLQQLADAGYQAHKCHLRRVNVLAMLWIAVNQLAALRFSSVGQAYHTLYVRMMEMRKGTKFFPDDVRWLAAYDLAKWSEDRHAGRVHVRRRDLRNRQPVKASKVPRSDRPDFGELSDPGIDWISREERAKMSHKSPQFTQFEANRSPCEGAGAIGAPGIGAGTDGAGTTGSAALGGSAGPWTGSGATMAGDSSRADGERLSEPTPPGGRDPAPTPTPLRTAQPPEN